MQGISSALLPSNGSTPELDVADSSGLRKKPQRRRSKYSHLDDRTRKRIIKDNKNQRAMRQRRELGESFEDLAELLGYDCNGIDAPDRPELMLMALQRINDLRRQIAQSKGESIPPEVSCSNHHTSTDIVPKIEDSMNSNSHHETDKDSDESVILIKQEELPVSAPIQSNIGNSSSVLTPFSSLFGRQRSDPTTGVSKTSKCKGHCTAAAFLARHGIPSFSTHVSSVNPYPSGQISINHTIHSRNNHSGDRNHDSQMVGDSRLKNSQQRSVMNHQSVSYLTTRKPMKQFNRDTLADLAMITSCGIVPPPPTATTTTSSSPTATVLPPLVPPPLQHYSEMMRRDNHNVSAASVVTASSSTSPSPGTRFIKVDSSE